MKTKKILGLGICALSLGMVAGVIGTRAAVEAKADKATTVYLKAGVWASAGNPNFYAYTWTGENANQTWTKGTAVDGTNDLYSFVLPATATEKVIFTRNDPAKEAGWGGVWNQSSDLDVPDSDKETVYKITDWSVGYWTRYVDVADGAYLAGDYNEWAINAGSFGTKTASNLGEWEGVELTATQRFKIVDAESKTTDWLGWKSLLGDDSSKALVDEDEEGNLKVKVAGTYNFYFTSGKKLFITKGEVAAKEYHVLGLSGWVDSDGNKMAAATEDGYVAKYVVSIKSGDKFKVHESSEDRWYGAENGILTSAANAGKFSSDGDGNIVVGSSISVATSFTIYLSDANKIGIVGAGETVADLVEPTPLADGYYIVGLGGVWTKDGAIASDPITGEHVGDKYIKTNLALTHGAEFKIVGIKDDAIDWNDKIAVEPTKSAEETDQSANFVTANDHNGGVNVKAIAGGTFNLYVNSEGKIYVFAATTLPSRSAADEVDQFIDDFIAPNVTKPDGEGKYADWETCDDKYTTAKKVLERLSSGAQSLFLTNLDVSEKIEAARAAYKYWEAHKDDGNGSYNVAGLATSNPTLIITISVIAGAALAGAGIYLISKKRKHN